MDTQDKYVSLQRSPVLDSDNRYALSVDEF